MDETLVFSRTRASIGRLRRGVRSRLVLSGTLDLLALIAAAILVIFALDYVLRLPRLVRAIDLLAAAACTLYVASRRLLGVASTHLEDDDLALLLEREHRWLRESLISAVQLGRPGNPLAAYTSAALVGRLQGEVEDRIGEVDVRRVYRSGRLWRMGALTLGLWSLLLVGVSSYPAWAWIAFRRTFLLARVDWPKRTAIIVRKPASPVTTVARGDDLAVEVFVERGDPDVVTVESTFEESGATEVEAMSRHGERVHRLTFENINEPFRFRLRGGDAETDVFRVEVKPRPRIERMEILCRYPGYTGLRNTDPEDPITQGNLKVPEGTDVSYRAWANVALEQASFLFFPSRSEDPEIDEGLEVAGDGPLEGSFRVERSGSYIFRLVAVGGFVDPRPVRYSVHAIPDSRPIVRITEPGRNDEATPDATVPIKVNLEDDYGVRDALFRYSVSGGAAPEAVPASPQTMPLLVDPGSRKAEASFDLELSILGVEPGKVVHYQAEATDDAGNTGASQPYSLTIVGREDMRRILQDQLAHLRDDLKEAQELQLRARRETDALFDRSALKPVLTDAEARPLARGKLDQQRVTRRLGEVVGSLDRIRRKMVENRAGDLKEIGWVREVRDRVAELGESRSTAIEKAIGDLREAIPAKEATPQGLQGISGLQKGLADAIKDIVEVLEEWGDLNAVIRRMQEILRMERTLQDETRGAVRQE